MEYNKRFKTKDNRLVLVRNAVVNDSVAVTELSNNNYLNSPFLSKGPEDPGDSIEGISSYIGDANAEFLCRNPFVNDGTATVSFRDKASAANGYVARNQVPVELSKPLNEECTVYYTVWDYDAETVIREGEIHFDKFEQQKWIHVGDSDRNTLVEVSGIQNIGLGENSFHYRKAS